MHYDAADEQVSVSPTSPTSQSFIFADIIVDFPYDQQIEGSWISDIPSQEQLTSHSSSLSHLPSTLVVGQALSVEETSPAHPTSSLPGLSRYDQEVMKELEKILSSHNDDVIELMVSLTHESRELLLSMSTQRVVWQMRVFEVIKADCSNRYGAKLSIKNLYIYFNEKGYREIALESLKCTEALP